MARDMIDAFILFSGSWQIYNAALQTTSHLQPPLATVRPARPEEQRRWCALLPYAAAGRKEVEVWLVVVGRVERIVGAVALLPSFVEEEALVEISSPRGSFITQIRMAMDLLVGRARERGAKWLKTKGTLSERSPLFELLRTLGFEATGKHDVYRLDFAAFSERLEHIFQRTFRRHSPPGKLEVVCGIGGWRAKLIAFLQREAPFLLEKVDCEYGYRARHAFLLLVDGEVQSVLFSETQNGNSFIAYQYVSAEFRQGFPLAYLLTTRESLRSVHVCPPRTLTYAIDVASNPRERLQAESYGGKRVDTLWNLKLRLA